MDISSWLDPTHFCVTNSPHCWARLTIICFRRRLHLSPVYSHTQPQLIHALITVMHKMDRSNVSLEPLPLIDMKRYYMSLHQTNWRWKRLPNTLTKLSYVMPPIGSSANFFLLQDYHAGADGRVWLATSDKGELVVIKFMLPQMCDQYAKDKIENLDLTKRINNEVAVWNHVWKVNDVRKIELCGCPAILMPFVFDCRWTKEGFIFNRPNRWTTLRHEVNEDQVTIEELVKPHYTYDEIKSMAKGAFNAMLDRGYEHNDMVPRHVALMPIMTNSYPVEWQLKEILIDFSRVTKLSDDITEQEKAEKREQFLENFEQYMYD